MLISYKFNNVFSFNQEAEFTMLAPATKVKNRFPNSYNALENGYNILKSAVIVGENAGGKSNFVNSISYFISFFTKSDSVSTYKSTINNNNIDGECPRKSDTNQEFEIELTNDAGVIYKYCLSIDFLGIVEERFYYKKNKTAKYEIVVSVKRTEDNFECDYDEGVCEKEGCSLSGSMAYEIAIQKSNKELKNMLEASVDNGTTIGLFVTKMALLGNKEAIDFINIVKNNLCPESNPLNYDLFMSIRNEKNYLDILNTQEFFEIFRMVDYSIYKIDVDEEKPFIDTRIYRKKRDGGTFERKIGADSSGVREFFAWAIQIYRVVYENKTVIADEMDRVLNPILSDRVIAFINGKKHMGQFIFTSHNILHLDLKNYMKEQIYFITKDVESLESELYSLADFPEVRYETTKIYEFYMKGILGGTAIE